MNKLLRKIDDFIDFIIEKIPGHIKDIIKKASYALLGVVILLAVVVGIQMGIENAAPNGMQLLGNSRDMLYLNELRQENDRRQKLFEDVEVDPMEFRSHQQNTSPQFKQLGRDTSDRLMGERDELIENPDFLRPKEKGPVPIDEDIFTPKQMPSSDLEIRESDEASLLKPLDIPDKPITEEPSENSNKKSTTIELPKPSKPSALEFLE